MKKTFTLIALVFAAFAAKAQTNIITNGDLSGSDMTNFVTWNWSGEGGASYKGASKVVDGAIKVEVRSEETATAAGNATMNNGSFADWDSQFFITWGEDKALAEGDKIQLKMKIKADAAATVSTQSHNVPGGYINWYCIGDVAFTTDWANYQSAETEAGSGFGKASIGTHTIAFNLAKGPENNFYFDDIELWLTQQSTGITTILSVGDAPRYNLLGQKVDANYKGIVIINGKKVIVK